VKVWNGKALTGAWDVTIKVDGVRAFVDSSPSVCDAGHPPIKRVTSRAGKPLYNLDHLPDGDYEIFAGSWNKSVSLVRRKKKGAPVPAEFAYSLQPLDPRLYHDTVLDPTPEYINNALAYVLARGDEGLVLRPVGDDNPDNWLKVKNKETHDVKVTGVIAGKGKHAGRMGALVTDRGNVGTGFTDTERRSLIYNVIGQTIEVECMGLTPAGKFRHPRFLRLRFDK
jgi:hypothetical protein